MLERIARSRSRTRAIAASVAIAALLVLGLGLAWPQETGKSRAEKRTPKAEKIYKHKHELWFFFSPSGPDLSKDVRRLRAFLEKHPEISLRPCLLVDDFKAIEKPSDELGATLKELRSLWSLTGREEPTPGAFSIRVWDEEGLAFARELGIDRLPSYTLVAGPGSPSGSGGGRRSARRAHVVYGQGAQFEELVRCMSK